MTDFISNHLNHFLFALLLFARMGDVLTTYIATPKLKLEANPIVRKLRWPFAWLTLLVAFVAYADVNSAFMLLVVSLLVCASNATWMWTIKVLGEQEYYQFYSALVRKASLTFSLLCCLLPPLFFFILGTALFVLTDGMGRSAAAGFILFAFIMGFYHTLFYLRVRRETRRITAIEKLTSQAILRRIAMQDKNPQVSVAAVNKITDQAILTEIANAKLAEEVRQAAESKLAKLN